MSFVDDTEDPPSEKVKDDSEGMAREALVAPELALRLSSWCCLSRLCGADWVTELGAAEEKEVLPVFAEGDGHRSFIADRTVEQKEVEVVVVASLVRGEDEGV